MKEIPIHNYLQDYPNFPNFVYKELPCFLIAYEDTWRLGVILSDLVG
jgi:hypothetical protein